jgi:hypothetical protein
MRERALALMRQYRWIQFGQDGDNSLWRLGDAAMTIEPNGDWRTQIPTGITMSIASGTITNLEDFLRQFAATNPRQ